MLRLALAFTLFLLLSTLTLAQFRSPTGRRVSIRDFPNAQPHVLFELSDGYLLGPNTRIHIASETTTLKSVSHADAGHQMFEMAQHGLHTQVRIGHGFVFVFANGKLRTVSGTGISLVPLKAHPGLFVNTVLRQGGDANVEVIREEFEDDIAPGIDASFSDRSAYSH